jgi:hypothetical protein
MLDKIIDLAIEENKRIRELNSYWKQTCGKIEYFRNFCTIHIDIGRAVGKTQYIIDNAKENDVIIVSSYINKNLFFEKAKTENIFYQASDIIEKQFDNIGFVYIDEPALFLKNQNYTLWDVYALFYNVKSDMMFILLGE